MSSLRAGARSDSLLYPFIQSPNISLKPYYVPITVLGRGVQHLALPMVCECWWMVDEWKGRLDEIAKGTIYWTAPSTRAALLKLQWPSTHLGIFLESDSDTSSLDWGLRFFTSNKFPGDPGAAGLWTTLSSKALSAHALSHLWLVSLEMRESGFIRIE